jgi:hypothetical protein
MEIRTEQIRSALDSNPTLTLLKAYSRDWVLPLFAEYLEQVEGSVSAEWFHERVSEAREHARERQSDVTPAERRRDWVEKRWLETETLNGRLRYRLSPYSLRALRFVHELVEGETTVSSARLGAISHAVRLLADMTSPDRDVQVRRIDRQISELRKRRDDIASGRVRLATLEEMKQQLREILGMTRSLPADFRQLRTMVEDRHQEVARRAMAHGPPAERPSSDLKDFRQIITRYTSNTVGMDKERDADSVRCGGSARPALARPGLPHRHRPPPG